jgi:hypothetical protein
LENTIEDFGINMLAIIILALTTYFILTAPLGYQDEEGFHYGEEDD